MKKSGGSHLGMIGNRIKTARMANGLSLQGFSDRLALFSLNLTKAAISNYENDKTIPSPATLEIMASSLSIDVNYFLKEEWTEFRLEYNNIPELVNTKVMELSAFVQVELEKYITICKVLGYPLEHQGITKNYIKSGDIKGVQLLADKIRREFSIGQGPISSVVSVLEDKGWYTINLPDTFSHTDVCGLEESHDIPFILYGTTHPIDDFRTNLLEQLGYFFITSDTPEATERLCQVFARFMLMPVDNVKQVFGEYRTHITRKELNSIKHIYGISKRSLMLNLLECEVINEETYSLFFRHFTQHDILRRKHLVQETLCFYEVPSKFTNMLLRAFAEGLIDQKTIRQYDPYFD